MDLNEESPFEPLEARQNLFVGQYRALVKEGIAPDATTGAIHLGGYSNVEIMPNGDVFGTYRELKDYLKSEKLTSRRGSKTSGLGAHRLFEDRFMSRFGLSKEEGLCVAIYADEHMDVAHGERGVDFDLPHNAVFEIRDVVEGHISAYNDAGRPEWSHRLLGFVRDNRERIIGAYENGAVRWATKTDIEKARKYLRSL